MKALNNLFAGIGILAIVVIFIFLVKFSGSIPVYVCFACVALYKFLIGTPWFIKQYYRLKRLDISWIKAMIPYYNESTIMSPGLSLAYLISVVAVALTGILFVIPEGIMNTILSALSITGIDMYVLLIRIFMVLYAVLSIIRGIAYIKIFIDIEETKCSLNNMRPRYSIIFILSSVIAFIPIARTFALAIQNENLRKANMSLYLDETSVRSSNSYDWNNY